MDWKYVPPSGGPYAVACPSLLEKEIDFNQNTALGHKSLFVRHHIEEKDDQFECAKSINLASVIHSEPNEKSIEFGYEVITSSYNNR